MVDEDGKPLKSQQEQANRWKEHFHAVIDYPEPDILHNHSHKKRTSKNATI